ncbi:MAG: hypothetical protein ACRBFS_25735 [Aureispira sp.]
MIKYIVFLVLIFFCSCSNEYSNLSKIGENYKKLPSIKNITLYYRSRGRTLGSNIYGVNTYQADCSPYFVEVTMHNFEINEINSDLRFGSCTELISEDKIQKALQFAVENNITYFKIDTIGTLELGKDKQFILPPNIDTAHKIKDYVKIHEGWYTKESGVPPQE